MRKKLSCQNCGQVYWAYAPADELTKATLESCELPDYDIVQNVECENCHQLFGVYWHNEALEKTHLVELKEWAYLKERYFAYGIGVSKIGTELLNVAALELLEVVKGKKTKRKALTNVKYAQKFGEWLNEFMETRIATLDLSPSQQRKLDAEIRSRVNQFVDGYIDYGKQRATEWEKTEEYAKIQAEDKKDDLPQSVPSEGVS